jgi:hypothetical protein
MVELAAIPGTWFLVEEYYLLAIDSFLVCLREFQNHFLSVFDFLILLTTFSL